MRSQVEFGQSSFNYCLISEQYIILSPKFLSNRTTLRELGWLWTVKYEFMSQMGLADHADPMFMSNLLI